MIAQNGALNGATAPDSWLQASVQQFFGGCNWEDLPPEVQQTKATASQPLSLSLSVHQFFAAFDWDGAAVAAAPAIEPAPVPTIDVTIDDFFNQF